MFLVSGPLHSSCFLTSCSAFLCRLWLTRLPLLHDTRRGCTLQPLIFYLPIVSTMPVASTTASRKMLPSLHFHLSFFPTRHTRGSKSPRQPRLNTQLACHTQHPCNQFPCPLVSESWPASPQSRAEIFLSSFLSLAPPSYLLFLWAELSLLSCPCALCLSLVVLTLPCGTVTCELT